MSETVCMPLSKAALVASYSLQPENHPEIEVAQAKHRTRLINGWEVIQEGSRVLEIGCGQGTCTAVLAEAIGSSGTIDAVDPASLDYGAPFTLGQAQAHLSSSAVGDRITWHQATPEAFLYETAKDDLNWDVAVFAHCIWYFKAPEALSGILRALRGRVKRICIAEYALQATHPHALPHVLAAVVRAGLEVHRVGSEENIQTLLSPSNIKELLASCNWKVIHESILVPESGLLDGCWETSSVISGGFTKGIDSCHCDERTKMFLRSTRDAVVSSVMSVGKARDVRTMDVWLAVVGE